MNPLTKDERMRFLTLLLLIVPLVAAGGCSNKADAPKPQTQSEDPGDSIVFLSVTCDAEKEPQAMDMAMKFAGFSLDEERQVVMFFNVKGVRCPSKGFSDELAFGENDPIKEQLVGLIERGADVHVCPICMKALGVEEEDLIDGAQVTTRPSLFRNIGPQTAVFTY